jgi:hypothetical protein
MEQSYFSQLDKQYKLYLQNLVLGKAFEPIVLRGGKNKPATSVELHKQIALFQKNEKKDGGHGWTIAWQDWSSKKLGNQKWPSQITVSTEADLLFLTNQQKHSDIFKELLKYLLEWNPALGLLIHQRPEIIHDHKDDWEKLKAVTDYLLANDSTDLYIRSIPVPAHTKFIQQKKTLLLALLKAIQPDKYTEDHTDLEYAIGAKRKPFLFPMRFLDSRLAEKYVSSIEYFAIPAEALRKKDWEVTKIILVENETNLYLMPSMANTLAIFSSGKALHLLKDIDLFQKTNSYYWGDLDEDGFIMLNDIRSYYPNIQSLFMDQKTVDRHFNEKHTQPHTYKHLALDNLTEDECQAYDHLASCNGRIEQERLLQDFVMKRLKEIV